MSAEEWLRERGIEIARQRPASQPGEYARYPTSALSGPLPGEPIEDQETRAVPSVVRLDLHIRGDITEWPTGKLDEEAFSTEEVAEVAPEAVILPIAAADDPDFALADEMTVPLPIIVPDDISTTPTRRLENPTDA